MNNPIVSVILVNYNSTHHTINCVNSICEKTSKELYYEIIVVDNNSRIEEQKKLRDWLSQDSQKDIIYFQSDINAGFTGGNMIGIKHAKGKYIYLLNNDCLLQNDALTILADYLDKNPKVAAIVPRILNAEKQPTPAFHYMPSVKTKWLGNKFMNFINPNKYPDRKKIFDKPVKVEVISGASMFLRQTAFDEVGYMTPDYFLYLEEEDLCMKLARAGYEIYHVPEAVIQHLEGESTTRNYDVAKEYYISLNIFLKKYCSKLERRLIWVKFLLIEFFRGLFNRTRFRIFCFILKGAPKEQSLRYMQKHDDSK